jgi:4-hydroxy-tetrahydrodipicolinate synthase
MNRRISGVCPIIATPFTPSGEVDLAGFRRLVRTLAAAGCHGLTLFGIAGEYYKLDDEEKQQMAEALLEEAAGFDSAVIVSVTDHATELAVRSAKRFAALGPDCLMLLPPHFLKPGVAAVARHVRTVAAAVPDMPIMVQYAPEQTGVGIAPEVFAAIYRDHPNVFHFKIECKPAGPYISRLLELTDGRVRVHVGNAGFNMIEAFARGAVGIMPGCSLFDVYLQICAALAAGNQSQARALHGELLTVLNQIRQDVEMIIRFEKHILLRRGVLSSDYCRHPSHEPDTTEWAMFDAVYQAIARLLRTLPSVG